MLDRVTTTPIALAAEAADCLRSTASTSARIDLALVLGSGWSAGRRRPRRDRGQHRPGADLPGFSARWSAGHGGDAAADPDRRREARRPLHRAAPTSTRAAAWTPSSTASGRRPPPGATAIVLTNGCGGLNPAWPPGTPVLIRDHINLTGATPAARRHVRRPDRRLLAAAARPGPRRRPEPAPRASTSSSAARSTRPRPRCAWQRPSAATSSACPRRWRPSPPGRPAWRCSASRWSPTCGRHLARPRWPTLRCIEAGTRPPAHGWRALLAGLRGGAVSPDSTRACAGRALGLARRRPRPGDRRPAARADRLRRPRPTTAGSRAARRARRRLRRAARVRHRRAPRAARARARRG